MTQAQYNEEHVPLWQISFDTTFRARRQQPPPTPQDKAHKIDDDLWGNTQVIMK
jgi:hypothetical protein